MHEGFEGLPDKKADIAGNFKLNGRSLDGSVVGSSKISDPKMPIFELTAALQEDIQVPKLASSEDSSPKEPRQDVEISPLLTPKITSEATEYTVPVQKLARSAERAKYEPHVLLSGIERPNVMVGSNGTTSVEESLLLQSDKMFATGDSHGLIFPMLMRAKTEGIIKIPLQGTILNADFHADIGNYEESFTHHTASWERYGVQEGLWKADQAYNFRPHTSTAGPYPELSLFSSQIDLEQARDLSPTVFSLDLDFFNKLTKGTQEYTEYLDQLKRMAEGAKVVMIFSSAGWTFDSVNRQPYQSTEQIEDIITEIQTASVK